MAALRADALARSLCAARDRLTVPLARLAAALVADRAWCSLGFARAADFTREHLGRSARWLRDLATLHYGLSDLAGLAAALTGDDAGAPLGRRRAFLVARIADPSTLPVWIARARRLTVRELHAEVVRSRHGSEVATSTAANGEQGASGAGEDGGDGAGTAAGAHGTHAVTDPTAADLDDFEDRRLVRVAVPRAVVAAFDEAVDLYRAVEGTEATVTSFIDALLAEASTTADSIANPPDGPIDTHSAPTIGGASPAAIIESAFARSTDRWRHLPPSADASWGLALGGATLARLEALVRAGIEGTTAERVGRMQELLAIENEIEINLGRLLASMGEHDAWNRLRFAGMAHYAEERLGLSRTAAQIRARAARALRCFPLVRRAYEHDAIGLEAALLLGRVLSSAADRGAASHVRPGVASLADGDPASRAGAEISSRTEEAWVRHAAEVTLKRLRDEERALDRFAAFRLAPEHGAAPPGDDDWHANLRREPGMGKRRVAALGLLALGVRLDPADVSRAGADVESAAGSDVSELSAAPFDPATALVPEPDVFLRLTLPDALAARFLAAVETARRSLTTRVESIPWDSEWQAPGPALLAARMFSIRSRRVPSWVGLLAMIEDFVATWDHHQGRRAGVEYRVRVRDGWRCAAPGCSARRNLDVHHVHYRSHGGNDEEWNLVCLCRFHHQRGEHGDLARCAGRAPLGLAWWLGTEAARTWFCNERRIAPAEAKDWPAEVPGN